jgi:REP element-mobilizing transposase RayT
MELNKQKYNPDIHHRRSIRLKGYDYSRNGLYFITICTHDSECLFGEIRSGEMILSHIGVIADVFWHEIKSHTKNVELHEFVVMPNHIHGIIEILPHVGALHATPLRPHNATKMNICRIFRQNQTHWQQLSVHINPPFLNTHTVWVSHSFGNAIILKTLSEIGNRIKSLPIISSTIPPNGRRINFTQPSKAQQNDNEQL